MGACTPRPIYDKNASPKIKEGTSKVTATMTTPRVLGIRWRKITLYQGVPKAFAARRYSWSFSWSTCPRTSLAIWHQPVRHMAIRRLPTPFPTIRDTSTTRRRYGILARISTIRIMMASVFPPKYAATPPYTTPMSMSMAAPAIPRIMEIRPPIHTRVNRSLPILSVPNQCSDEGSAFFSERLTAS